jgi:putative FmdB family regulatory protein
MRLFDLQCTSCQHIFEELVNKEDIILCPLCNSNTEQLMTTSVRLPRGHDAVSRVKEAKAAGKSDSRFGLKVGRRGDPVK